MKLTLTQFITYKLKVSTSSRITYLRRIKKNSSYSPYTDYWRNLRQAVAQVVDGTRDLNYVLSVPEFVSSDRQSNYRKDANRFFNYIKDNKVKFIPIKKAKWQYKDLIITANPELGMEINGKNTVLRFITKLRSQKKNG